MVLLELRKQICLKIPFFAKWRQKVVVELWLNVNKWPTSLNEPTNEIGKKLSENPTIRKCKVLEEQFIKIKTSVVQGGVSSAFETLTLVSRYFKHKVYLKFPNFTQFAEQMVKVKRLQLKVLQSGSSPNSAVTAIQS